MFNLSTISYHHVGLLDSFGPLGCFAFLWSSVWCLCVLSPRYNRTSWLGVNHQLPYFLTYLLVCGVFLCCCFCAVYLLVFLSCFCAGVSVLVFLCCVSWLAFLWCCLCAGVFVLCFCACIFVLCFCDVFVPCFCAGVVLLCFCAGVFCADDSVFVLRLCTVFLRCCFLCCVFPLIPRPRRSAGDYKAATYLSMMCNW